MNYVRGTLAQQVEKYVSPSPEGAVLMSSPPETGDGNRKSPPPSIVGLLVGTYMRSLCLFLKGSGPCLYKWDTHIVFWIIYTHHQFSAMEGRLCAMELYRRAVSVAFNTAERYMVGTDVNSLVTVVHNGIILHYNLHPKSTSA